MQVKVVVRDEFKPVYANETDACMDLKSTQDVVIKPGEVCIIDSGVQIAVPEDYVLLMYVRSSTGIKKHLMLANGTGVVDTGFRESIKMALYNFGKEEQEIKIGDRICQFLILPRPKLELNQVEDNEEFRNGDRGGGIGSTGNNFGNNLYFSF